MSKGQTELMTAREAQPLTKAAPTLDIENIFKYAIEHQGTAETMEKLMAIRRELNAEAAKKAFDEAMAAFQAECPVVTKITGVPTAQGRTAYKFAPFEHVIATVKPCLQKHGFCWALDTDTESQQGWVIAKCHVTHSGGHTVTSTAKFPLGTKTGIMSETQVYASALTFASRRVFQNAFGIVCAGEDFNGATEKPKPTGPASATSDTRKRFVTALADIQDKALAYAIDLALIEPNQTLEYWPLEHIPMTKAEFNELREDILKHE